VSASSPAALAALCQEGLALHRQGRLEEARRLYQKALQRDPRNFDALFLLGTLTAQLGQAEAAATLLGRAVRANPRVAAAQSSLGAALNLLERHAEALASLDAAVALDPALPEAHFNRGLALAALGRREDAVAAFDAAIARAPGYAKAYHNRGAALRELKRYDEAIASFDRAVALQPPFVDAIVHRGIALLEAKRPAEALTSFDAVLALDPAHVEAHANRGVALAELLRHEEALVAHDAAIALNPDDPEPHSNRALALEELRRLDEAMEGHERAVALGPGNVTARVNRAFAYLLTGRFEEGWREYEWRRKKWPLAAHALDRGQPWRGEPLAPGERLFVYHEQGLGDAIQFSRFIPEVRARGIDLAFSVQTTLRPLLAQLAPGGGVMADNEPAGFARYCSIMSLPLALGVTADAIPSRDGYLRADPERRARMTTLLGERRRPRIGLAWSGNPANTKDLKRCIPFEALEPLLSFEADWLALQNEIRPADAAAFQASGQVRFLGPQLEDFADTAALCDLMDLVISVDTSLAHLAGALGKPVWVMLPFVPDWRWMLGRADSPWYASARLFRQARPGDWMGLVAEARRAVEAAGLDGGEDA
jgi:tetratricopeptide (TPR) repeat protein